MQESDMKLLLLSGLLLFSLFVSLCLRILYSSHPSKPPRLPPGCTGLPLLGETREFFSRSRAGTPEKFFSDRMRKHSPHVFKTSLVGEKTAVFCGPAGHKFLFSNDNRLVASWWPRNVDKIFPSSLQSSSGEESIKMRKMLPGFLKPDSLREYVGIMDSIAREQMDTLWNCKEVAVLPLAKKYTFSVASRLFLSIDDPVRIDRFEKQFHALVAGVLSIPLNFPGTPFNRAIRAAGLIRKELLEIIGQRKVNPAWNDKSAGKDILDHMLTTPDENGQLMTELDISDKIIGLLMGGHDTASAAISFIVKYLAELPDEILFKFSLSLHYML